MGLFGKGLFARHEIDRWRDEWTLEAAIRLNNIAAGLGEWVEAEVRQITMRELIMRSGAVVARVAPETRKRAEPAVRHLITEANAELSRIVAHQAVWQEQAGATGSDLTEPWEGYAELALAAAPFAGGVAVAAALPFVAITTSAGFLGLFATTVISWPIVAVGGAVAFVSLGFGARNTGGMRAKFETRLKVKAHAHIAASLMRGADKQPAVLEQLTAALSKAAAEAKGL